MNLYFVFFITLCIGQVVGQDFSRSPRSRDSKIGSNVACIIGGICGGVAGYWFGRRRSSKHYKTLEAENSDLLEYIKLQTELYKLQETGWKEQYNDLEKAYKELHQDTVDRDYDEFKAPDTDNDDMISSAEFDVYVKKYLSSFPELSEKDFPKFVEFDLNSNGKVSFSEWQEYLAQQKAIERKKKEQQSEYNEAVDVLYEDADPLSSKGSGSNTVNIKNSRGRMM